MSDPVISFLEQQKKKREKEKADRERVVKAALANQNPSNPGAAPPPAKKPNQGPSASEDLGLARPNPTPTPKPKPTPAPVTVAPVSRADILRPTEQPTSTPLNPPGEDKKDKKPKPPPTPTFQPLSVGLSTPAVNTGPAAIGGSGIVNPTVAAPPPAPLTGPLQDVEKKPKSWTDRAIGGDWNALGELASKEERRRNPLLYDLTHPVTGPVQVASAAAAPAALNNGLPTAVDYTRKAMEAATAAAGSYLEPLGQQAVDTFMAQPGSQFVKEKDVTRQLHPTTFFQDLFGGDQKWADVLDNTIDKTGSAFDWAFYAPQMAYELPRILPSGVPGTEGEKFSLLQAASSIGAALNKTLNPINPNFVPITDKEGRQWWREFVPVDAVEQIGEIYKQTMLEWKSVNDWYDSLPPDAQAVADIGWSQTTSGPAYVRNRMEGLLNRPALIEQTQSQLASLSSQIETARANGDLNLEKRLRREAANLQIELNNLNTQTTSEYLEAGLNPWAEAINGVIFDPTNLLPFHKIGEAIKEMRTYNRYNISAAEAVERFGPALERAQKITGELKPGERADLRKWWQIINPLSMNADSRAAESTDQLWSAAVGLLANAKDKDEAKAILKAWVENPAALVDPAGDFRIGAGVVANKRVLEQTPILQVAGKEFDALKSLAGDAPYYQGEVLAELNDLFYKASRQMFGLESVSLPAGTLKIATRRLSDGTMVIDYLGKGGKLIKSGTPGVPGNIIEEYKALNRTVMRAGKVNATAARDFIPNMQRAILSDIWLHQRPAHWIRNAASATMHLMADGIYSLRPVSEIRSRWEMRMGAMASRELQADQTLMEGAMSASHWTERLLGKDNPYASLMKKFAWVWTGDAEIPTPLGKIPFGEHAFRTKAFDVAAERALQGMWQQVTHGNYAAALRDIGVPEDLARSIVNHATNQGIVGNRQTMEAFMRSLLSGQTIPISVRDLMLPRELLDPGAYRIVDDALKGLSPDTIEQTAAQLRQAFQAQIEKRANIINSAPPVPTVPEWTAIADSQDLGEVLSLIEKITKKTGIKDARADIISGIIKGNEEKWANFRRELAAATGSDAVAVGMDAYTEIYYLKKQARAAADGLAERARANPQEYNATVDDITRVYRQLGEQTDRVYTDAREALSRLANGEAYTPRFDEWKPIDDYLAQEDQALRAASAQGRNVRQSSDKRWRGVVESSRQIVDNSALELFDAFKANPTQETLDIISAGQRAIGVMGAQVTAYLRPLRDAAIEGGAENGKLWDAFFKARNEAWQSWTQNAELLNKSLRQIVYSTAARESDVSALRWASSAAVDTGLYHGSPVKGLTELKWSPGKANDFGSGIYLSNDKNIATNYGRGREANGKWMADYLSGKASFAEQPATGYIYNVDPPWKNPLVIDNAEDFNRYADQGYELAKNPASAREMFSEERAVANYAHANGYDGIIDHMGGEHIYWGSETLPVSQTANDAGRNWIIGQAEGGRFYVATPDGYKIMARSDIPENILTNYERMVGNGVSGPMPVPKTLDGLDFFGLAPGEDLLRFLQSSVNESLRGSGLNGGELSRVLSLDIEELRRGLKNALERLPELAAQRANALTPAQRQQALDAFMKLAPQYDNVLAAATDYGVHAADFAMLNYGRRRNIDAVMGWLMPYHYYWSRTGANWIKRIIQRPSLLNMAYEYERAKRIENTQSGANQSVRTAGTWPNPLHDVGIGPERMRDPGQWLLPWNMYAPNVFNSPEDASTETGKWLLRVSAFLPGLQPLLQAGIFAAMDQVSPREDGRSWLESYQIGDFVPLYNMAGYAHSYMTGNESPGGFWGWGDEFSPGRVERAIATTGEGAQNPEMALWAQDVQRQHQRGLQPLPEQPAGAEDVYRAGVSSAAAQSLWSTVPNFLFGIGLVAYPDKEKELRAMNAQRQQLAYNEQTQPFGGRDLMTELNVPLDPLWNYTGAYPGNEDRARPGVAAVTRYRGLSKDEWDRQIANEMDAFAATGERTSKELKDKRRELEAQRDAALAQQYPSYDIINAQRNAGEPVTGIPETAGTTQASGANQAGGLDATAAASAGQAAAIPAAGSTLDELAAPPTAEQIDYWKGANPTELADAAIEQAVYTAYRETKTLRPGDADYPPNAMEKPVRPQDGAPQTEWNAYKAKKKEWDALWDKYNEKKGAADKAFQDLVTQYTSDNAKLSELVAGNPVDLTQATIQGKTAQDYIDAVFQGDYGDAERQALADAEVVDRAMDAHWNVYNGLTTAQKRQYFIDHPDFAKGYLAAGYDQWWTKPPTGSEAAYGRLTDPADQKLWNAYFANAKGDARYAFRQENPHIATVLLKAYNPNEYAQATKLFGEDVWQAWENIPDYAETPEAKAAREQYFAEHPNARLLNAWLYGRSANFDPNSNEKDFGKDYATAQEMFGDNIWDLYAQYSSAWDRQRKSTFFRRYPQYSDFQTWWYGPRDNGGAPRTYTSADGLVTYNQWGQRLDALGHPAVRGPGQHGSRRKRAPFIPYFNPINLYAGGGGSERWTNPNEWTNRGINPVSETAQIQAPSSKYLNRSWTS